jgi:deazaflavin-dependent oxidoreductase (nitroreductase family)
MTDLPDPATTRADASPGISAEPPPRFGGILTRLVRRTTGLVLPLAGKRWNPLFAVVLHRGRRSGRAHATPVAARRMDDGFVIALAFGARVDWYRNLRAAGGGRIRWRGRDYPVGAPEAIGQAVALPAFLPVQRVLFRLAGVAGFIRLRDEGPNRG